MEPGVSDPVCARSTVPSIQDLQTKFVCSSQLGSYIHTATCLGNGRPTSSPFPPRLKGSPEVSDADLLRFMNRALRAQVREGKHTRAVIANMNPHFRVIRDPPMNYGHTRCRLSHLAEPINFGDAERKWLMNFPRHVPRVAGYVLKYICLNRASYCHPEVHGYSGDGVFLSHPPPSFQQEAPT